MPTRPTLAALLRSRSRRDIAAFVAALYAARGATTRVDTDSVTVVDDDRYLVVPAGYRGRLRTWLWSPSSPVDYVVAVDCTQSDALSERYDASVLTPTDLDHLARYGLDRTVADQVFGACFDCTVADVVPASRAFDAHSATSPPTSTVDHVFGETSESSDTAAARLPQSAVLGVLVVATLVVLAATTLPSVGVGLTALSGLDGSTATSPAESGAGADEVGVANEPRPTTTPTSDALSLAPGLSMRGVDDPEALAAAHATEVANRSYTWELTYVEFVNGNESGRATETVRVARPTVYASTVTTDGFLSSRGPISFRSSYADGDQLYRPTADGVDATSIEQRGDRGLQEARARQYYSILLDAEETSVARTILGDPRLYVVNVEGTSASTVRNYTATAHVAPDGIIVYYSGSYCSTSFRSDSEREVCLSITMQYRNVDLTTVEQPAWYTNATTASTPARTSATTATTASTPAQTSTTNVTPESATSSPSPSTTESIRSG